MAFTIFDHPDYFSIVKKRRRTNMPQTGTIRIALMVLVLLPLMAYAQTPEVTEYKIVKGDTLWEISKGKLNDAFLWPKVWKENPAIANPDRIYPDQIIKIPLYLIHHEKTAPASAAAITQPATPDQSPKEIKKEEAARATATAPREPSIASQQRYKDLKGIILYDGQVIYGQILKLSADSVTIRTEDHKVASYSFIREVQNFIKE
jgi:LysM repeat protein